ncbi:coenzyme F420-0:L-glutamate ligase [Compostimonas suwonensis]|uniref:Coenzyme F420-0:L-glutamate ligase/coenzyme F420-1:gamma-L-glutamate ligase n=1 Tax=Compostimonas suwonensis TaxID=1048394 RepID=A0A2M9BZY8_9MICO|nr:coenzyme F420-0:L-glutamate ligase [Compostimonas suwonensis]PJJ63655.1 coenzyme F420-0:L-glutamate ligase/coenzyme F420-1:gamma-L-glutamate ligase [Compostimonas suwonensis]
MTRDTRAVAQAWAVGGIPEIETGDDLAEIVAAAIDLDGGLADGDIVVVTSKIVSKAEGRLVNASDREDAITSETVRVVATRRHPGGVTRIVENRLGIVAAAAGVDASNTPEGTVLLLPVDPDASARRLCDALRDRFGVRVGVLVTDTLGRPWRTGQTDAAIGAAGMHVVDDLRGTTDSQGRRLDVTVSAVADEIAAFADLVKGKSAGLPLAIVRGLDRFVTEEVRVPGARSLVRASDEDMFRLGSAEAHAAGYAEGHAAGLRERVAGGDPGSDEAPGV